MSRSYICIHVSQNSEVFGEITLEVLNYLQKNWNVVRDSLRGND